MIIIDSVSKSYGDIKSLNNICVTVKNGSIFGMVGSNGSGKSTLLRIMCGIFQTDAGSVCYDGENVYDNSYVKESVLYLSDDQYFLPHSTITDMMNLYAAAYQNFDKVRYKQLCGLFNLDPARKISTFSKGMQKQTALLLALSAKPKYLLCDETFDGLDPVMRLLAKRIIAQEAASSGLTTIIASHSLRDLEDICDHICLLHKGGLLFESEIDSLKDSIHAVQVVLPCESSAAEFAGLKIVSLKKRGSMSTVIVRGTAEEVEAYFKALNPQFFELTPLTLEEIFISEMEERGYDYTKIIL